MNKWMASIPILMSLFLAGCSTPFSPVNNIYSGDDQTLSTVPAIVQKDAVTVGKAYGDPSPTVTKVVFGPTFDNSRDMYRVTINGHFVRKGVQYKTILFSMLDDGSGIGSISDSNDVSKLTFVDNSLPAKSVVPVSISQGVGNIKIAQAVQAYLQRVSDPTVLRSITILNVTDKGKNFGKEQWSVKLDIQHQASEASAYNQGVNDRYVLYTESNNQITVTGLATGMPASQH